MYCCRCGKVISHLSTYCPACGNLLQRENIQRKNICYYQLPITANRFYSITVYAQKIVIEGKFWYLRDKEFYRNKEKTDTALIQNFLGMGYLKKRSYKKCVAFILSGLVLTGINAVMEKLNEWTDNANFFLQWIGKTIALPEWMGIVLNVATVICMLFGIVYFFSKKKVVEISFTDKRICIPQKSISDLEFNALYQVIKQLVHKKDF